VTRLAVLCVDDEPMVLQGLEANLRKEWEVTTATSGAEGLEALATRPHAVVISDMRMPGMSGAKFLATVRAMYPDIVRMLLTGHADLTDAAEVSGSLYRMLLKPCPAPAMLQSVREACRHYELQVAERTLLEQTLHGAVGALTDILGVVHPLAFGRANRVTAIVKHVVERLALVDGWQVVLAAMLSQIGCITFESGLIERAFAGSMTVADAAVFRAHPQHGKQMIERIGRLEGVATLVADQLACTTKHETPTMLLGCQVLRCALAIDNETSKSKLRYDEAIDKVLSRGTWDPTLAPAFRTHHAGAERRVLRVQGADLRSDMRLEADAVSPTGELWMSKGTVLTYVAAKRLHSLAERGMLAQPLLVGLPS
jgi:response regulator RpfG family c-di-GMP phosphodiesterase